MEQYAHLATFGFMVKDTSRGSVRRGPAGAPLVLYDMNERDRALMQRGVGILCEVYQRAGARRVLPLVAGHDEIGDSAALERLRAARLAPGADNRRLDFGAQQLRSEDPAPENQASVFARDGGPEDIHRPRHPGLRDPARSLDCPDLLAGFDLPLRKKCSLGGLQPHPFFFQEPGQSERKIFRHQHAARLVRKKPGGNHPGIRGLFLFLSLDFFLGFGKRIHAAHLCLTASAVEFEIRKKQELFVAVLEKNKGIRRAEPGGIKQVGGRLARRDDEFGARHK